MANSRKVKFALSVGIFLLLVVGGNVACWATPTDDSAQCLDAAKNALGSEAEVLKCGHLTAADALETIAVMRLKQLKETKEGIPVSRLVVLRRTKSQWITELAVDRNSRKNRVGYIAMDFIDDTPPEMGFRALFSEKGSQQVAPGLTRWLPGFTITLVYLDSKGGGRTVLPLT